VDCAACAAEVRGLEELNRALVLPDAPPVAFHPFWAGIAKRLPRRAAGRPARVVRRTLVLAFALTALLILTTTASAFASDRILPDSPLYSLKLVGENVRIDLTLGQHDRVQLELQLAAERLREARSMAGEQRNQLAVASLRSFQSLLADASPALQHPAPAERQDTLNEIGALSQELTDVQEAAGTTADESDIEVQAIVQESQASLTQDEHAANESQSVEPGAGPSSEASREPSPTAESSQKAEPSPSGHD